MTNFFIRTVVPPFHYADPAGVLFFGNIIALAHTVFEQFVTDGLNYTWQEWFKNDDIKIPVRAVSANYVRPLFAGSSYTFKLAVKNIGKTSFTTIIEIFCEDEMLCSEVNITHVYCEGTKSTPIPQALLSKLYNFFT